MKEKETGQIQTELTTKPVNPTLEVRGIIYMPEPGGGEIAPKQEPVLKSEKEATRIVPQDQVDRARKAWASQNEEEILRGAKITRGDRETQEMLIKMGMSPISGGSGDEPSSEQTGPGEPKTPSPDDDTASGLNEARASLVEEAKKTIKESLVQKVQKGEINIEEAATRLAKAQETLVTTENIQSMLRESAAKKTEKTTEEYIDEAFDVISSAEEVRQAEQAFGALISQAKTVINEVAKGNFTITDETKTWYDLAKSTTEDWNTGKIKDLSAIQNAANELMTKGHKESFIKFAKEAKDVGQNSQPQSLEQVIELIVNSENPDWQVGGERELMNEKGEINMTNFLGWIRDKAIYNHEFNPDGNIDLFSQIYIPTPYRQIGLGELISTPRYFRKQGKDGRIIDDETAKPYHNLKDHILYEVWLFQNSHNFDAKYRLNMGSEEKAIETLMEIHAQNIFTRNKTRLYNILTLPSLDTNEVKAVLKGEKREKAGVGQGIRQAELAYNYLYEIGVKADNESGNQFERELGTEGTLQFYRTVFERLIRDKFGAEFKDIIDSVDKNNKIGNNKTKKLSDPTRQDLIKELIKSDKVDFITVLQKGYLNDDIKLNDRLTDAIRKHQASDLTDSEQLKKAVGALLKKTHVTDTESLDELNIFSKFEKQRYIQDLLREGIQNAIGKTQDLSQEDLKYAEHWAFSMVYWTGISARNDVHATGFDGLSKLMNFKDYRVRQAEGRGGFGDLETIYRIKRLGLTMWEALRVKDEKTGAEKTLLEALQGGRGDNTSLSEIIPSFNFAEGSQSKSIAVQHYANIYGLYKFLMTEHGINFDRFLGKDNMGRTVIVNQQEADKLVRELRKYLRYGFDMGNYYYDRDIRSWFIDMDGKMQVDTKPLQDFMFNQRIIEMGMYDLNRKSNKDNNISLYEHSYRERIDEDGRTRDVNGKIVKKDDKGNYVYEDGQIADLKKVMVLKNMSRNIFADSIATEYWMHRNFYSQKRRYTLEEFDLIEEYLRSLPLEIVEDTEGRAQVLTTYFGKEEFSKVREEGKVDPRRLELENLGLASLFSTGGGLMEMIKALTKRVAA